MVNKISRVQDVIDANRKIRAQMDQASTKDALSFLKRQSDLICEEVYLKDFGADLSVKEREEIRKMAIEENRRSVEYANHLIHLRSLGDPNLELWG